MSFLRHREIFRPIEAGRGDHVTASTLHRFDEFPAGYSSASCSPAEPASAWPASGSMIGSVVIDNDLPANCNLSLISLYHRRGAVQLCPLPPLTVEQVTCGWDRGACPPFL